MIPMAMNAHSTRRRVDKRGGTGGRKSGQHVGRPLLDPAQERGADAPPRCSRWTTPRDAIGTFEEPRHIAI